jgi:hypothetical protein
MSGEIAIKTLARNAIAGENEWLGKTNLAKLFAHLSSLRHEVAFAAHPPQADLFKSKLSEESQCDVFLSGRRWCVRLAC